MLSTRTVRKWSSMVQLSHTWDQVISGSRRVVNNTQDVNKMSDGHRNVVVSNKNSLFDHVHVLAKTQRPILLICWIV